MKTKTYLGILFALIIHVVVYGQTQVNNAFTRDNNFVLGYAFYTDDEKREFSTIEDPSELIVQAETLLKEAQIYKERSRNLNASERDAEIRIVNELTRKAETKQLAASELLAYYNRIEFQMSKTSFINLLGDYLPNDSTVIYTKKLLLMAVRSYKLAREIREEAYAHTSNEVKIAHLKVAEEKEMHAFIRLNEAREILKTAVPAILAKR